MRSIAKCIILAGVAALGLTWTLGCHQPGAAPVCPCPCPVHETGIVGGDLSGIPNLGLIKLQVISYHDTGRWHADRARVGDEARAYLASIPQTPAKLAAVFDIDETSLSNWKELREINFGFEQRIFDTWVKSEDDPAIEPSLQLFRALRERGVTVFFITGRSERMREPTAGNLRKAGYEGWEELLMTPVGYDEPSIVPFKSGQRRRIEERGYRIILNIGDQDSDLEGGYAERCFKLPNPAYYIP